LVISRGVFVATNLLPTGVILHLQRALDFLPLVKNEKKKNLMEKKEVLRFRCTPLEKAIIEKKASNSGLSASAFCRASALDQKIGYKLTDEELEAYQMLVKYHNNFMAISNLLKNKNSRFAGEVNKTAVEIKNHLKKFK